MGKRGSTLIEAKGRRDLISQTEMLKNMNGLPNLFYGLATVGYWLLKSIGMSLSKLIQAGKRKLFNK